MAQITFQVTQGTSTQLANDQVGTTVYPISKIDVGNTGSSVPWQGSVVISSGSLVQTIGTINTGTMVNNGGTVGVLQLGTVDAVSALPLNNWATTINVAGTAFGTLKSGIGGSAIYITDLVINNAVVAGTMALYNGATSSVVGGTWSFNINGGLVSNFRTPLFGATGSAICYQQVGTAALSITATGFVR